MFFKDLSDGTAPADRETKRGGYARLPGVRRHVPLEHNRMTATVRKRSEGDWLEREADSETLDLPELGVILSPAA